MNEMQITQRGERPRGASIWTALIICLVLAVVGLAALGYALYHANSDKLRLARQLEAQQNETKRRELAEQKAGAEAKLTMARNQQEQLLAQVGAATNALQQLLAGTDTARAEAAALGTNEAGRAVALHPDLVALAGRCYESQVPELAPEAEIITRLEAVRRVEQQVLAARGTTYEPAPTLGVTVQNATVWAEQGLLKVGQVRDALSGLARESKIKFTRATLTANSPTLSAAIAQRNEDLAGGRLRQAEQTVSAARTNAVLTRADADATAEKTRAEADAQKTRADADRYAEELRRKLAEEQAAKEREWEQREAQLRLEESKTKVAVLTKDQEARKVELRKKAQEPEVLEALAPFITPGRAQINAIIPDPKPLSFTALSTAGALADDMTGLAKLVKVASTSADKERPRWKMNPLLFQRHPDEVTKAQKAQRLLVELGPVLVEMGKLQP